MIVKGRVELSEEEYNEYIVPYRKIIFGIHFPTSSSKKELGIIYEELFQEKPCEGCAGSVWLNRLKSITEEYEQKTVRKGKTPRK